jgi:hypothetical protein
MYNLCERCGDEIAWEPDFADYVTGCIVTLSLQQQNGVVVNDQDYLECWCDDCIKQHARYDEKTRTYYALSF